jgi:signal transduction histidine kinase
VLSALLLLAGLGLVVVLQRADHALTVETERAAAARVAASRLLTSLVDQETGLRGFALTHDERFLAPYQQGIVDEQRERAELERAVAPGDSARLALLTVDAAVTAWRDQYASLRTATAGAEATDAAIQFGRELFDRVRQASAALDARLLAKVVAAQREARRDRTLVVAALATMFLAIAAAVLGLQRALQRSVLAPMGRLAAQVDVVSRGEHLTPIRPDGPPDLQAMGAAVESMRVELVAALAEVEQQQRSLEQRATDLARSNADLEQFAYVASHDLQEPLRKVASFCQLLEQRYAGQLDERGEQYLAFAIDGAKRMQQLIEDLLTFSRVGRRSSGFGRVDLATAVARAWSALSLQTEPSGARLEVELGGVAAVHGDRSLIDLLLVNLVGNAVKYRRPEVPPVVRVSAGPEGELVRVEVADNGIGIPPVYAERVFVIFQRLHARDEYDGTGIGLALAKRIVEFHGGTIEVVPSPLGGACLSFTLPAEASDLDG